ncbi:MAG TPA: hypothetical protein VH678_19695, partial [Xanthobacteraceae bacterium]
MSSPPPQSPSLIARQSVEDESVEDQVAKADARTIVISPITDTGTSMSAAVTSPSLGAGHGAGRGAGAATRL